MGVINTFQGEWPHFSSTLTRIDDTAAPAEMLPRLDLCRVLVGTGIPLQLVRSTRRHGESLVIAVFSNMLRARTSEKRASIASRGHECVLDGWMEKAGSERRYREGSWTTSWIPRRRMNDFPIKTVTRAVKPSQPENQKTKGSG